MQHCCTTCGLPLADTLPLKDHEDVRCIELLKAEVERLKGERDGLSNFADRIYAAMKCDKTAGLNLLADASEYAIDAYSKHKATLTANTRQLAAKDAEIERLVEAVVFLVLSSPASQRALERTRVMRETIEQYANPANWSCARCTGNDHINCAMKRWEGPTEHGYEPAQAALDALEAGKPEGRREGEWSE